MFEGILGCYRQNINERLYEAIQQRNLEKVKTYLTEGADPNWKNKTVSLSL